MFGQIIQNSPQIIQGHLKELTNQENELYEKRIKICRECPLFGHSTLGDICDSKKCWDTVENKLVPYPGPNAVCGCQCRLQAKTRIKNAKCVLNKW